MIVSIRSGLRPPSRAVASRAFLAAILILAPPAVAMAQAGPPRAPATAAPRSQATPPPRPPAPRVPSAAAPTGGPPAPTAARAAWPVPAVALAGLSGYSHPEVPQQACRLVNAGRRDCWIPGRTAGRYRIAASGVSMAVGARPRQQLTIIVGGQICAQKLDVTSWSGKPREIIAACEVAILTDAPVQVSVVYADLQALKEARGPTVEFDRMQWTGVLNLRDATAP
jgi:hypothetical protein